MDKIQLINMGKNKKIKIKLGVKGVINKWLWNNNKIILVLVKRNNLLLTMICLKLINLKELKKIA